MTTDKTDVAQFRDPAIVKQIVQERQEAKAKPAAKPKAQPRKTAAKAPVAKAPAKPRGPVPKREGSMAQYIDRLLVEGISWEKLATKAAAEAKKRGTATLSTIGMLRSHVKYRASQTTKWAVEQTPVGVRMNAITKPKTAAKAAKAKAAKPAPKKAGRATGRKVAKTTENGRQTVTEQRAPETEAA